MREKKRKNNTTAAINPDESKIQLQNLLSNLPGIAYRCLNDKNWTMKFMSSGSIVLTGYKPEDFLDNKKRSFASIIHPEDRNIGRKEIKTALRKKKAFEIEYRIIDKSGEVKWIWEKGSGVYDKKNKLIYVEGFINDISIRVAAKAELNQKWLNYHNLVDAFPSGIFIHVDGKVLFGNRAAYEIAEINPNAHLGKISLLNLIIPEDRPLAYARISKVMLGKEMPFTDYRAIGAKGTHKDIRVKGMPIIFNSIKAVQIIIQDVTLQKKLEEERVRTKIAEQINRDLQKEINLRIQSEQKLKAIFESSSHLIWTINRAGEIISYNKQYAAAMKKLCGTTLAPGIKTTQFKWAFSEESYSELRKAHKEAFNGKYKKIELQHGAIDGKTYHREMHFHPIVINGKINEIAAIAQDTTARRNAEKQTAEQSAHLRAIFESGSQLMWTVNKKISLTSFNKNYADVIYELYGIYPKLNSTPGKYEKKADTEEYRRFWDGKYEEVFKGKSVEFYTERTSVSGKRTHRYIFLHPIYNEKNEVIEASCLGYDISEQKKAEEEILNKQSQLSAIINTTVDIIFSMDRNYALIEFNQVIKKSVKERTGKDLKRGTNLFDVIPANLHAELKNAYDRALNGERIVATEIFLVSGQERIYEAHYNPIKKAGKITGVAVFSRDITEQKRNEEEILKSLKEKDVLLKEVHHRVKNNLQVISSILNLQTAYLKDKGTINILKECQNRIKTMAFIHESLYQNKDFSQINFSEYIVTLVKNLFYSFETDRQKIRANFDVDEIHLSLDTSIPCGLIVNELVSNALKYAFSEGGEGAVFVQLKKDGEKIKMVISDNGVGMPKHIDYKNTETLGLQLVSTLVEQISGNIRMKRNKGTIFEIIF